MIKKLLCVLFCLAVVFVSSVSVFAADFVTDGTDANYYWSVFPVDYWAIHASDKEPSDWLVNVPYPGNERLNPFQFDSASDFFYSYQVSGTGANVVDSRVNFHYNSFESSDYEFGAYQTRYNLSSVTGNEPISYHWGYIELHSEGFITKASAIKNLEVPVLNLWWNSTETFVADTNVNATVQCVVSWYEEVEGDQGTEYYLRYTEVDQAFSVDLSEYVGTEILLPYIFYNVSALANVANDELVSVDDFTLTLDISDLSNNRVYLDVIDHYASAQYTALSFMPWTNNRPIQDVSFWDWILPPLTAFMNSPVIFGWSMADLFGIILAIIFILLGLKYFAGG